MDIGFGAVLDKIEEYFGRGVTRFLLVLVGVAVAAACVGVTWTWLVAPLLAFFQSPQWQKTIITIALASFGIGAGVALGLFFVSALGQWRRYRAVRSLAIETETKAEALISRLKRTKLALTIPSTELSLCSRTWPIPPKWLLLRR